LTYGLATIGTWSTHQTKSNNKHCQKPNKKLPNANPNIWTNNIRHSEVRTKFGFSASTWCYFLNFKSSFWYSVLLHTFSHFLTLSHTFSHFLTLSHTFSHFLTLSHTFSNFLILSHTFSYFLILSLTFSYFLTLSHTFLLLLILTHPFSQFLSNLSLNQKSKIPSLVYSMSFAAVMKPV